MRLSLDATVPLGPGIAMPRLGLGVYQVTPGDPTRTVVLEALRAGYRLVDTARAYRNEADVGRAIRDSGIPREEIFVTTKLWNDHQGYDNAIRAFHRSLEALGLDAVDLYLIHWPVPERRLESWRALVELKAQGLCRAIGVSNYLVRHLEELRVRFEEQPAVNQVEVTPFLTRSELRAYCRERGIVVESYSPLTRGKRLDHPVIRDISVRLGRSPAQILIRWALQGDLVVIPKTSRREHLLENAAVFDFELSSEDMARLDALDEGAPTGWDPETIP